MSNQVKGLIYAIISALTFGILPVLLKVAVEQVEPETVVWFRFLISFLLMFSIQLFSNPKSIQILIKPPLLLVIAALGLTWNYMGFMLGLQDTSASNAQVIIQIGTILLGLAGIFFFKEKVRPYQLAGFLLTAIGFVLFYREQLKLMIGSEDQYNWGVFIIFTAALAWALYAILQKKLIFSFSPGVLNLFLFALPSLILIPFVNFSAMSDFNGFIWLSLLSVGVDTFIAYLTISYAMKYIEASKVSVIILMNPIITFSVMALLTALEVSWITGEKFSLLVILGAAIIIAGAVLVVRKPRVKQ